MLYSSEPSALVTLTAAQPARIHKQQALTRTATLCAPDSNVPSTLLSRSTENLNLKNRPLQVASEIERIVLDCPRLHFLRMEDAHRYWMPAVSLRLPAYSGRSNAFGACQA